jgi:hypothetical protein
MLFPTIPDYKQALLNGADTFATYKNLEPVLDKFGDVYRIAGGFAVVFKMRDRQTGKLYALKCFHKKKNNLIESYAAISRHLKTYKTPYLVNYEFLEKEMWVSNEVTEETEFPVVLMDWVEGRTLREELKLAVAQSNTDLLRHLSIQFDELALWLLEQPFAHTDVKTENILVTPGRKLVLVDYDGFFVPEMQGQEAREEGTSGYKHPKRSSKHFNRHTDDFSLLLMSLSLRLIADDPDMYTDTNSDEHLLFTEKDLEDFNQSKLHEIIRGKVDEDEGGIGGLFSLLKMALAGDDRRLTLLPVGIKTTLGIEEEEEMPEYSFELIKQVKSGDYPESLNVSLDGNYIVGVGEKGKVNVYRIPDFEFLYSVSNCDPRSFGYVFSPDGQFMSYAGASGCVKLHRVTDDTLHVSYQEGHSILAGAGFSPDGQYLACGDFFGDTLGIYSLNPLKPLIFLGEISKGHLKIEYSPNGDWLATCNPDGIIKVIDNLDLNQVHEFVEENQINCIAFSADGAYLASGGYNGTLNLYELSSGTLIHTFNDLSGRVNLAFSPDGNLLAVGSETDVVTIYDMEDYSILKQLTGHNEKISSIAFTADGKYLTIRDNKINIYQVYCNKEFAVLPPAVVPASWFNMPERRLNWWNSLEYDWQKVFCKSVFNKPEKFTPSDEQLVAIFSLRQLYVRGPKVGKHAELDFMLTDVTGVQYLTGLEKFVCYGNNITDLTPLQNLKHLKTLSCSTNNVLNIAPLAKLTRLETLVCDHNSIYDLEPLAKLGNLTSLDCSHNKIKDLTPLNGMLPNFYSLTCKGNGLPPQMEEKYTILKKRPPGKRDTSFLVRAGQSIGNFCLGDSISDVVEMLGDNYSVKENVPGESTYTFRKFSLDVSWRYPDKKIHYIKLSHPAKAKTTAGIEILKNTVREAAALYGKPVFQLNKRSPVWMAWFGDIGFGVEKDFTNITFPLDDEQFLDRLIVSMAVRMK